MKEAGLTVKVTLDDKEVYNALTDAGTFGTVLHAVCLHSFGETIYDDDPLELYMKLQDRYGAQLCEAGENKLQAMITSVTTDAFYDDAEAFRSIVSALSQGDPGVGGLDDITVAEIFWAIYEVELNREAGLEEEFTPAIQRLITEEINEEAEDEGPADVRELRPNYVLREIAEQKQLLYSQLRKVGFRKFTLPPIS